MKSDHVPRSQTESWTDEKHVRFLNSMEASFVRTMFENNHRNLLRLDRFLPDTSDSTLDFKSRLTKKLRIFKEFLNARENCRIGKRSRRIIPSQPLNSSSEVDDQVVPQFENRVIDENQVDDCEHNISDSCTSTSCLLVHPC